MSLSTVDVPLLLERLGIEGKRRGREIWACCPLPGHEERTPSWQIKDDPDGAKHGLWRCLGQCHDGGTPVTLVQKVLGCTYREAEGWIRDEKLGNSTSYLCVQLQQPAPLPAGFVLPAGTVIAPLRAWVSPARAYAERRGLTEAQVERWGLGYSVDGRLAGRIVLPWRDARGQLTGYTARTYLANPKKYLEPDAEEGADRSAVYGEQHWSPAGERSTVVVTEGGLDGLAVERAAAMPFGAVCGSVLLPGHVARLSTWQEVVIASDPDKAGRGLAGAIYDALARWTRVRFATLPAGYDCAKLERERGPRVLRDVLGVSADPARRSPAA